MVLPIQLRLSIASGALSTIGCGLLSQQLACFLKRSQQGCHYARVRFATKVFGLAGMCESQAKTKLPFVWVAPGVKSDVVVFQCSFD